MRIASLALLAALCACSYEAEKPDILVQVANVPAAATHLDVVLTDSAGAPRRYTPSFGPGAQTQLSLAFAAPAAPGAFTVNVTALDRTATTLATGSAQGSLPSAASLQIALK